LSQNVRKDKFRKIVGEDQEKMKKRLLKIKYVHAANTEYIPHQLGTIAKRFSPNKARKTSPYSLLKSNLIAKTVIAQAYKIL